MSTLTPPLKYHGGKHYLARKIVDLMPPHTSYVEPYFGGGSVLLAKNPEGVSEVVNDIDEDLSVFWRVLQSEEKFDRFQRLVSVIPFSEDEWRWTEGDLNSNDMVHRAAAFFVRCRQSLAGRMESFAPISKNRMRRGMNEQVSAWLGAVEGLPAVHARLSRVAILNRPASTVISQLDGKDTLFYLDPTYMPSTRKAKKVYKHEMTVEEHGELLELIRVCKGKVMISGYYTQLYSSMLDGWKRHDFDLPNNSASGRSKRRMTECLWTNFASF